MAVTHYVSMIVVSVASCVFGLIPMAFAIRVTKHCPFFLSLILCLGGGILLATSIVHMLTEVQEKLKHSAQLYFSLGFLILYTFDEICHLCLESRNPKIHQQKSDFENIRRGSYGAIKDITKTEISPFLKYDSIEENVNKPTCTKSYCTSEPQNGHSTSNIHHSMHQHSSDNEIQCHVEMGEPQTSNPIAKTGLLLALVVHSILEGVAIGVQTKFKEILLLLGTITFHKVILSFCLGLELQSHGVRPLHLILSILVFSFGSALGIFIGTIVTTTDGIFNIDSQMQAVAAGSLLYVAAFEILPRERYMWQQKNKLQGAGLFQLFAVILGFMCITALHIYVDM
ncbi:hypothetical protein RUM43_009104 [Polyplax serrata]|uniref:Zinc transporter ZIP3 n=1 Tax=Polyplax serrata TaxID=468196 RepID=A0AAN8S8D4_POLSC